ncbi:single-stranded DNA-binding protein [Microbacterium gorillae]|uniref:single-stranded DNA-binding protein n=1 Tax=Microbacterium gorillae TaxID=1231063 RepID=UPI003D95DC0E
MNGIPLPIVGNLTADPELRYTQNGIPVANFTIAHTPREFDRATNQWKDKEAIFLRTSAWRELAEHVAASLVKGQEVVAIGKLSQRSYLDANTQQQRTAYELELEDIGVSLRWGTTVFTKSASKGQATQPAAQVAAQAQPAAVNGGYQDPAQQAQPAYQAPQGQPQYQGQPQAQPAYQAQAQAPAQPQYQAPQVPAPAQPAYAPAVAGAQAAPDDIF